MAYAGSNYMNELERDRDRLAAELRETKQALAEEEVGRECRDEEIAALKAEVARLCSIKSAQTGSLKGEVEALYAQRDQLIKRHERLREAARTWVEARWTEANLPIGISGWEDLDRLREALEDNSTKEAQ